MIRIYMTYYVISSMFNQIYTGNHMVNDTLIWFITLYDRISILSRKFPEEFLSDIPMKII